MATPPIDFLAGLNRPNPTFQALSQLGSALQDRRIESQAFESQQRQETERMRQQQVVQEFLALKNPTIEEVNRLALTLPKELGERIRKGAESLNQEQLQNQLKFQAQGLAVLDTNPTLAPDFFRERAELLEDQDPEEAAQLRRIADQAEKNPSDALKFLTITTGALPGGQEIIDNVIKLRDQRRESQFAKIDPLKFTAKSIKDFEKSGSFADLVSKPASLQEIVTGKDRIDAEKDLRKEFTSESKVFKDTRDSYGRIRAVGDSRTAAGDLALIFNFMKMLDPGSVVRESEFRSAEQAKAWLTKAEESGFVIPSFVKTAIQKADPEQKGAFLLPVQRQDFLTQARKIMDDQSSTHKIREKTYKGIATRNKLDIRNVVIPLNDPDFREDQTQGLVVDIPEGSEQIGTSGGKRVFQSPDGRTFIED